MLDDQVVGSLTGDFLPFLMIPLLVVLFTVVFGIIDVLSIALLDGILNFIIAVLIVDFLIVAVLIVAVLIDAVFIVAVLIDVVLIVAPSSSMPSSS